MDTIKDMTSLELASFLLCENLISSDQADKFVVQEVDGETLLGMTVEQLVAYVGCPFGRAMRLMSRLKNHTTTMPLKESAIDPQHAVGVIESMTTSVEEHEANVFEDPFVANTQVSSNKSSYKVRKGKLLPLPFDPVTDIAELKTRIFGRRPRDEYTNMWGKGYLESYHPRAHATYNKNVDKMRNFFTDVYNPIVANAWASNFKEDKKAYNCTLEFIRGCVPELEKLVLTIGGANVSIVWEADDIMRGWFLDHKKHKSRQQRLEQIASIRRDEEAFVNSLPNGYDNSQVAHHDGTPSFNDTELLGKNHPQESPQLKCIASSTEDIGLAAQDFATPLEGSTPLQLTVTGGSQSSNNFVHDRRDIELFTPSSSPEQKRLRRTALGDYAQNKHEQSEGSHKTEILGNHDSDGGEQSEGSQKTEILSNQDDASGEVHSMHDRSKMDLLTSSTSPEQKQLRKTPGGVDSTMGQDLVRNPALPGRKECILDGLALKAMPSLVRKKLINDVVPDLPQVSNSSLSSHATPDAHSPNQSITSTETNDSVKLKQPKKLVTEFYKDRGSIQVAPQSAISEVSLAGRTRLPTVSRPSLADISNQSNLSKVKSEEVLAQNPKVEKLKLKRKVVNASGKDAGLLLSKDQAELAFNHGCLPTTMETMTQNVTLSVLDDDSKLTVAYIAMKLKSKKDVNANLKSFAGAQNKRVQLYNDQAGLKSNLPFPGYAKMAIPTLLDLLVTWALQFKVKIVNPPKPVKGKVRLYVQHVQER